MTCTCNYKATGHEEKASIQYAHVHAPERQYIYQSDRGLLLEGDGVAARSWVLHGLEVVQRHTKLAQQRVAHVLQFSQHLVL